MKRLTFEMLYLEQQIKLVSKFGRFIREQPIGTYRGHIYRYDSFYIILFYHKIDQGFIASLIFNNLSDIDLYAKGLD